MAQIRENYVGRKYGMLTVTEYSHSDSKGHSYWKCVCDCGNETVARGAHLKVGNIKTCGCAGSRKTHGLAGTRLYHIWYGMKARCNNPKSPSYKMYGGRGITVCDEWMGGFEPFSRWALENGYAENLSLDRIDNSKGYSPSNCRWATAREQANNTRRNRFVTSGGETLSVTEWSRRTGIKQTTLSRRIHSDKWSVEDALTKEVRHRGS